MKWLFLLMIFDLSVNDLIPRVGVRAVFDTEEACNKLGKDIEREFVYEDKSLKSFSMCLPQSAFNEREMTVQRFDLRER